MAYKHMNEFTSNQELTMKDKVFGMHTNKGTYYAFLSQLNLFHLIIKKEKKKKRLDIKEKFTNMSI